MHVWGSSYSYALLNIFFQIASTNFIWSYQPFIKVNNHAVDWVTTCGDTLLKRVVHYWVAVWINYNLFFRFFSFFFDGMNSMSIIITDTASTVSTAFTAFTDSTAFTAFTDSTAFTAFTASIINILTVVRTRTKNDSAANIVITTAATIFFTSSAFTFIFISSFTCSNCRSRTSPLKACWHYELQYVFIIYMFYICIYFIIFNAEI